MPYYDYACGCGTRFERLVPSSSSPAPPCPDCGRSTSRRPPAPAMHGSGSGAAPPPAPMGQAPRSWRGLHNGDREVITNWRRVLDTRQEFEARHPEHKEHRDAVAAHEGSFEHRPLTYRELAARATHGKDATSAAREARNHRAATATVKHGSGGD